MDTHLTPAQKNAKVAEIKAQENSLLNAPWIPSAVIVVIGLVIVGIAFASRGSRVPVERPMVAPVPVSQSAGAGAGAAAAPAEPAGPPMTPAERLAASRAAAAAPKASSGPVSFEDFVAGGTGAAQEAAEEATPADPLPVTQAQVDAIPYEKRGISFFTSRPLPLDELVDVPIVIGGQIRSVYATPKESENIALGDVPPVRGFVVSGVSTPWYRNSAYNPYTSFWQLVADEAATPEGESETVWFTLGSLDPNVEDYLECITAAQTPPAQPEAVAPAAFEAATEAPAAGADELVNTAALDNIATEPDIDDESEAADDAASADSPATPRKNTAKIGPPTT